MVRLEQVSKRFGSARPGRGRVAALDDVSIEFAPDRVTAIVGPNGAGKSTLLAIVLGFLQPSSGFVLAEGMSPRAWVRRHGAAYLPERFTLPGDWRVGHALRALARLEGLGRNAAHERAREVMDRCGLTPHAHRRVRSLSRGLLQRLGLAQTLLAPRRLVVLDEPTEGLDAEGRVLFREITQSFRAAGATVLIASHDLGELERMADRAVLIESGRIRETMELRSEADGGAWTLRLASAHDGVAGLFPGARRQKTSSESDAQADTHVEYLIHASDVADLNARLAALLARGAIVLELSPARVALEDRVRQALRTDPQATDE